MGNGAASIDLDGGALVSECGDRAIFMDLCLAVGREHWRDLDGADDGANSAVASEGAQPGAGRNGAMVRN